MPIEYRLPVASAQVKSALLLAGLNAPGWTRIEEPEPTRDHTERMLRHFGAQVRGRPARRRPGRQPARASRSCARAESWCRATRPRRPSSLVAALIVPGSRVTVRGVGLNPARTGLFDDAARDGRRPADRQRAHRGRRAGGRPDRRLYRRCAASTCRPSARPA